MRQTDAGVARCAFDNGTAGLDKAQPFGMLDDEESGAILDGATGVLEFGFAEDVAAGFFRELLEADERRLANGCVESARGDWPQGLQVGLPSMKPRCPMPWALDMFTAVWCTASDWIWPMLSAPRHAEAAKPRAAVLNISRSKDHSRLAATSRQN